MQQEMPPEDPQQPISTTAAATTFKSFSLTVQKKTTIEITALPIDQHGSDDEDREEEEPAIKRAKISHFQDGVMITDEVKPKKKELLVINKVISKDWRLKQLQEKEENGTITDEEKARLALMLEAGGNENVEGGNKAIVVNADGDNADDPDYSQVKIEDFGMAVLRGYGFKEDEGIGKTNKQVVKVNRQERRVKNLGLGATVAAEEDLKNLKVGSKILVTAGKYCDKYGIVESLDPDTMSSYVKLALNREMAKVSQLNVKLVSAKEYEQKSKVLNQKTYDTAYEMQKMLLEQSQKNGRKENEDRKPSTSHRRRKSQSRSPTPPQSRQWASENLRVRVISKNYKRGDYYKTKMIVLEASDRNNCLLKDEEGRKHELKEKEIETVIPKGKGGKVMVLAGKYRGSVGRIVERDDKKYKVWVALHESDDIVKVDFDDACEYVGYIEDLDLHEN